MAQGDFQFGRLVLQRLGLGGDRKPPVAQLKRWLESRQRRRDPDEAHRLARIMSDWHDGDPSLDGLKRLGDWTGLSLDTELGGLDGLLGLQPREDAAEIDHAAGRKWLTAALGGCRNLFAYALFVEEAAIDRWAAEASPIDLPADLLPAHCPALNRAVELAEGWAAGLGVAAVSAGLLRHHARDEREGADGLTMADMIDARVDWTRRVPEDGEALARIARCEAYLGIYRAIAQGKGVQYLRYPAVWSSPDPEVPDEVRALRVRVDPLPAPGNDRGWMVMYDWDKTFDPADRRRLLDCPVARALAPTAQRAP